MKTTEKLLVGDTYKHIGYLLVITKREGDICFAENPEYGYEVFRVRWYKEGILPNGDPVPAGERPPTNSQFGKDCQHYPPRFRQNALLCFRNMVDEYKYINEDRTTDITA